jgi:hypothetical protein
LHLDKMQFYESFGEYIASNQDSER